MRIRNALNESAMLVRVPDPREQPTLSVPDAGAILGIGRSAAYEAVRLGTVPSLRIGRRVRVPTAALCRMVGIAVDPSDATESTPAT